jgi:FkbM family methyltransferase
MRPKSVLEYVKLARLVRNHREIARFARRSARGRDAAIDLRDGRRLQLRGGSHDYLVFREVYVRDVYRLDRERRRWECVVDLGANVGFFAARVANRADRVICYEPMPANFAQLKRNVAGFDNVIAVPEAVDSYSGTLRLHHPLNREGTGQFSKHAAPGGGGSTDVNCLALDDVFAHHGIEKCDLLKIDVEGAEYDILYAADARTLARIGSIRGEYHAMQDRPRHDGDALAQYLKEAGFAVKLLPQRKAAGYGLFFAER